MTENTLAAPSASNHALRIGLVSVAALGLLLAVVAVVRPEMMTMAGIRHMMAWADYLVR